MTRKIGLHLRQADSFLSVVERARRLNLPFFQCFLNVPATKRLMHVTDEEVKKFMRDDRDTFTSLYLHASYWINLATCQYDSMRLLRRELALAQKLSFSHVVLHAGSATGCASRSEGIDNLARGLNAMLREFDFTVLLENTAHGNLSIGGDLHDFVALLNKIDQPEKLQFCIDTAHAHAFGYDLVDEKQREAFMHLAEQTLGKERIALLHLNDTTELLGAKIDRHEMPGVGKLGQSALKAFMHHELVRDIPIIIEPPALSEEQLGTLLSEVAQW